MRLCSFAWLLALVTMSVAALASDSTDAPPQHALQTYPLPNSPNSVDISPDEKLVVTESTIEDESAPGPENFVELVQVWNFKEGKLAGQLQLQRAEVDPSAGKYFRDPTSAPRFIRFSADGSVIAAYVDHVLHVLRTKDLTELKRIELKGPNSTTSIFKYKGVLRTTVTTPRVRAFELSPKTDVVAVLWVREMLYGRVELYDLSSGKQLGAWDAPQGFVEFDRDRGLAWHPNGDLILLAVPNETPCLSPGNTPDVFAFGVPSGTIRAKLKTGLLVGDIAVTADNRVLAVDTDCMTVFKDHDPKLKVFDLNTGKHLHDLHGRGTGVRYTLSVARNGERVLAYTGKLKINFDWLDFVALDVKVDSTFSVWNLKDYSGVVSSQDLQGLSPSGLRISTKGRFAVSCGKASAVYELPLAAP
jgi:hypothetical protein